MADERPIEFGAASERDEPTEDAPLDDLPPLERELPVALDGGASVSEDPLCPLEVERRCGLEV